MPAGDRKMPEPMVMPMTSATELHRPRVRGRRPVGGCAHRGGRRLASRIPLPFVRLPLARCSRHASRDTIPQRWRARCGARAHRRPRRRPARHARSARHRRSAGCRRSPRSSRRFRDALDPRLKAALVAARRRAALHAPGGSDRARAGRPPHRASSRRRRRARRSATTRRCSTRSCRIPSSRALYLFPTKALAQDQLAELQAMCETIDGRVRRTDRRASPTTATRRRTRAGRSASRAHLVLSNPDMVHSGILPHHPRWAKLFENLRYVIIDELHAYRGVFGSHLCNVLRRLRRICRHYGSNPVVPLLVGDDCRTRASWPSGSPSSRSSWWTRAARRAARSSSCS